MIGRSRDHNITAHVVSKNQDKFVFYVNNYID